MNAVLKAAARLGWLFSLFVFLCLGTPAQAHKGSESQLRLQLAEDGTLSGRWDIALRDIDTALGLDTDGDGAITWGELRTRHAEVAAWALASLQVQRGGMPCTLVAGEQLVEDHGDGMFNVMPLSGRCAAESGALQVQYRLMLELDAQHRGLLSLKTPAGASSHVLDPNQPPLVLPVGEKGEAPSGFGGFFVQGVWHIWIGLDHILFLVSLLLPAVLLWQGTRWVSQPALRPAAMEVLKIVTAFTVAHSITLAAATLEWVQLPSRWVEAVIALSVALAALNNLWPERGVPARWRWVVAFGFGLIHGFGFASVLAELELPRDALWPALLGFNLGVEAGQLAIVAVFMPLAWALRRTRLYRVGLLGFGSTAIVVLATLWFFERALNLKILG